MPSGTYPALATGRHAVRARFMIKSMGGRAARGKELFEPLEVLDNCLLLIEDGIIVFAGSRGTQSLAGWQCHDLGDVCLLPPMVNAHTHLQLSWLKGQCLFNAGFASWLADMIPRLLELLKDDSELKRQERKAQLAQFLHELAALGTCLIGDVGGTIPGELSVINRLAGEAGLGLSNFCEHFGYGKETGEWPERCREDMEKDKQLSARSAPCGHALYSTSLAKLCKAKACCARMGKTFSMHLAESREENLLLLEGRGPLYELYRDKVLPEGWRAPGLRPYALARKNGLLEGRSLLIHGVWLNKSEIRDLSSRSAALCLCPRSNANLACGQAPIKQLLESGVKLCLGTDGLSSNTDLNVMNEVLYLKEGLDLPMTALLRMASINGAEALGAPAPALLPGSRARFATLPAAALE